MKRTINQYIAVEFEPVQKTKSGIYLVDNDPNMEYHTGVIRIKGEEKDIKVGDRVIYKHYRNLKFTTDKGLSLELVKYEDIIGIL